MAEIIDPTFTVSESPEEPGQEIALEGWHASYGAGGCLRAGGVVDAKTARRVQQGHELKAYIGGRCVWSGPVSAKPLVYLGNAALEAEGWVSKVVKESGRLLYASWDLSGWTAASGPPYFNATSEHLSMSSKENEILCEISDGTTITNTQQNHMNFAAPGTPGGITRLTYNWRARVAHNQVNLRSLAGTFPTDPATVVGTHSVNATSGSVDQAFTSSDLVGIQFQAIATAAVSAYWLQLYNLIIYGIASGSIFTTSQVVTDILGRLGFDTSGVQSSGVNAMPYDLKTGNWFSGLEYMALLDDRPVVNIVPGDDGTRRAIYRGWGDVVHDINLDKAEPVLNSLPLYNAVCVSYPHVGGFQAEVTIRPSDIGQPDPLAGTDTDFCLAVSLSDVQPLPDATLATAHGQAVLARLLNTREEGTFTIPSLMMGDALHGDHLNVSDWAPLEARELPINSIEFRQGQPARVSIHSPGSELGLAARFGLQQARIIQNPELPAMDVLEAQADEPVVHADCHTHSSKKTHHKEPLLPKGKKAYRHKHVHSHEKVKIARHKQESEAEPC